MCDFLEFPCFLAMRFPRVKSPLQAVATIADDSSVVGVLLAGMGHVATHQCVRLAPQNAGSGILIYLLLCLWLWLQRSLSCFKFDFVFPPGRRPSRRVVCAELGCYGVHQPAACSVCLCLGWVVGCQAVAYASGRYSIMR